MKNYLESVTIEAQLSQKTLFSPHKDVGRKQNGPLRGESVHASHEDAVPRADCAVLSVWRRRAGELAEPDELRVRLRVGLQHHGR